MYSSRMRTARMLTVSRSIRLGVSAQGGVCRGMSAQGCGVADTHLPVDRQTPVKT